MSKSALATAEDQSRSVAPASSAPLPSFLKDYKGPRGDEDIDSSDITIPRLKIAQAISDEVKSGALDEGALFLNVTGEAVWKPGDAPLPILIVHRSKEYILWRDRKDEGGGIMARAKPRHDQNGAVRYPWDKPNETFSTKVGGKVKVDWKTGVYADDDGLAEWGSEIPGDEDSGKAATEHFNYIVLLPTFNNNVAAISLSRSQVKAAKALNTAIKMGDGRPLPVRKFAVVTVDDQNKDGQKYKNWKIVPAGNLVESDAELAKVAMGLFKDFTERGYTVDQSDTDAVEDDAAGGDKAKRTI